jgi:uncharacterized FlaG/YvyC family protein
MTTIQSYLEKVSLVATGAGKPAMLQKLSDEFGVEQADVDRLPPLVASAREASVRAQAADATQSQATAAMQDALKQVKGSLSKLRTAMNNNLKRNHPLFKQLGLTDRQPPRQEALIGYAAQVMSAGAGLGQADAAVLAKLKWDQARFAAAQAQVETLRAANQAQETAKGEASAATRDLYDQIDQLDEVFRPLAKNARAALRNEPGALEELGLKAGVPKKPARP